MCERRRVPDREIYRKIGASTRAAAGLYAVQHGVLPEGQFDDLP